MAGEGDDQADVLGQWLATRRTPGSATADTLRGRVRGSGPSALESRRAGAAAAPEVDESSYVEEGVESPYVGSRRYVEPEPVAVEPVEPVVVEPVPVEPEPEPVAVEPEPEPEPVAVEPEPEPEGTAPAPDVAVPQDREHVMENLLAQLRAAPEPMAGTPPVEVPGRAKPRRAGARRKEQPAREPRQRTAKREKPPKPEKPAKEPKPAKEARPAKQAKARRPPKPEKPPRAPRVRRVKRASAAQVPTSLAEPVIRSEAPPADPFEQQVEQRAAQPARPAREHPLAPTLVNGPITHPDVSFKPRAGAQRLAGVLLLVTVTMTGLVGYAAYEDRSVTNLGVLAILAILTVVIWALRISAAPATVRVVSGILEIEDGGKHYSWDLRSPHTPIEVRGRPGWGWRVWLHRPNASTYVVDSSVVNGREFMRVLRLYRPDL